MNVSASTVQFTVECVAVHLFCFKTKPNKKQEKPWHYLLNNKVGSFSRIMALVHKVADLLTVYHEVNTVCSKDQKAVVCMM